MFISDLYRLIHPLNRTLLQVDQRRVKNKQLIFSKVNCIIIESTKIAAEIRNTKFIKALVIIFYFAIDAS